MTRVQSTTCVFLHLWPPNKIYILKLGLGEVLEELLVIQNLKLQDKN
jgi:hypothetical protein